MLDLSFKRIQFTPDLMPADITGTEIIEEDRATGRRAMEFIRGPVFANIVLADEINRTPPKTQAALLEAMQEGRVTVQGVSYDLPRPFHVLATQNPIEMEGTYPLPEAQLDRFMFQITDRLPARGGRGGGRQADDLAAGLRVRAADDGRGDHRLPASRPAGAGLRHRGALRRPARRREPPGLGRARPTSSTAG